MRIPAASLQHAVPDPRYQRQTLLPQIGEAGQARLARAHVVIVGVGALGCSAADLLARAGVGAITLIDRDVVEMTNLHRQVLFDERDAAEGVPKAEGARRRLAAINSAVRVRAVVADVRAGNVERLVGAGMMGGAGTASPAIVLDGTDTFETRYLLNDVCVKHSLAYIYGGVVGAGGMYAAFVPGGPCLRCVFPDPPAPGSQPTCDTAGVLGPAVAMVGAGQATLAIRLACGGPPPGELVELDAWTGARRAVRLGERFSDCPCCAGRDFVFLRADGADETSICGRDAVQVSPRTAAEIDLPALATKLARVGSVQASEFLVRVRLDGLELTVFPDARAIVKGTTRADVARAAYARYVGS